MASAQVEVHGPTSTVQPGQAPLVDGDRGHATERQLDELDSVRSGVSSISLSRPPPADPAPAPAPVQARPEVKAEPADKVNGTGGERRDDGPVRGDGPNATSKPGSVGPLIDSDSGIARSTATAPTAAPTAALAGESGAPASNDLSTKTAEPTSRPPTISLPTDPIPTSQPPASSLPTDPSTTHISAPTVAGPSLSNSTPSIPVQPTATAEQSATSTSTGPEPSTSSTTAAAPATTTDAPGPAGQPGKMPAQLPANYDPSLPVCSNCTTQTTPLWRRDESGSVLCNACALFQKMKGRPRPMSLKTDVIKQRNRVRKDRGPDGSEDVDGAASNPAAKGKGAAAANAAKGKGKAIQPPALKPHLAAAPPPSGSASDRGTSRSRDPLRNARKSVPGGSDAAAMVAESLSGSVGDEEEDEMEVDELDDDDGEEDVNDSYSSNDGATNGIDGGSASKRRRRKSGQYADGGEDVATGRVRPPSSVRRLSSANRTGSRSTSRARHAHAPRAGSVDRSATHQYAVPPTGYPPLGYPYMVPSPSGNRWIMPAGAAPYGYYQYPPQPPPPPGAAVAQPPPGYPTSYAPHPQWATASHVPPGYPTHPPSASGQPVFGTSALRLSSSADAQGPIVPTTPHSASSVRFAASNDGQSLPPSSGKSLDGTAASSVRSASVDRPPGVRYGSASSGMVGSTSTSAAGDLPHPHLPPLDDDERGRSRGRLTLPPLRSMVGEGTPPGYGSHGPPGSFEASAWEANRERRATSGSRQPRPDGTLDVGDAPPSPRGANPRGLRASSIVSTASSDSASRGRPSPGVVPTFSPALQHAQMARRDSPRYSGFGSIEEEQESRMALDDEAGAGSVGSLNEWSASRRGRSETRKENVSRGPSGGSGGSVASRELSRNTVANGASQSRYSPSPGRVGNHGVPAPTYAAFAASAVAHAHIHPPTSRNQQSGPVETSKAGVPLDGEEIAVLRTRVAELEIINGLMESRLGQLEERSRSASRSMSSGGRRGSSGSRGGSRGGSVTRGRGRAPSGPGLPTPTSSRERAQRAAADANREADPGEGDGGMATEQEEKEDEAVFAAELEMHGISGLDESTRTAMLGLLRAKYGYRAGDLEPDSQEE